jgi:holo-ACP synthase CitX
MLAEFLDYRERKMAWLQVNSREKCQVLLTFRINAPGAEKRSTEILKLFQYGYVALKTTLDHLQISYEVMRIPFYTPEWLAVFKVEMRAQDLKQVTIQLEEENPCGRLFDLDVWDTTGEVITRESLELPLRKCFLCDATAYACGRDRKHPLEDLYHYIATKAQQCF